VECKAVARIDSDAIVLVLTLMVSAMALAAALANAMLARTADSVVGTAFSMIVILPAAFALEIKTGVIDPVTLMPARLEITFVIAFVPGGSDERFDVAALLFVLPPLVTFSVVWRTRRVLKPAVLIAVALTVALVFGQHNLVLVA